MDSTSTKESSNSIAIIGLSCRFPGDASSPSAFWDLLKNGRNGYSETTKRYNAEAFAHPKSGSRLNVIPTQGGYFLEQDPYVFDAAFFNITAAEAMALDPRQRITMEVAYEALENAGLPLQKVTGTQTACFMGSSMSDYRDAVSRDFGNFPKYHILGVSDEMIANRISHFLNIHGPSATVQTACSSSLVATHLACQSLRTGESEMAIAGGVGLILGTEGTMHLNNLGFLNPAGHSMSFDAEAGGYGRGEGCGVIVLKRLDAAIRDGNNIRAVIRASGVNSDGWTQGVTMPSQDAQAALIRQIYASNGLDFSGTQYVEAHGTGTKAGDPIEIGAIHSTIGQNTDVSPRQKLYVGSVKPNIGHLEAAAGVASIIKGVMALEHGIIPPNIRFNKANPLIPFNEWNMAVPTKSTPWPMTQVKRMSINGFGMGGTNAHLVLESRRKLSTSARVVKKRHENKRMFAFSSHDRAGFSRIGKTIAGHLEKLGPSGSTSSYLADLANTLAIARSGLAWKEVCLAETTAELCEQLMTTIGENATRSKNEVPRIGFVFTGQGAQWAQMGIELLARPVFGESVAKSATFLQALGATWDPIEELSRPQKESRLSISEISQPICTVLQVALVDELQSWGIKPSKVIGHSSGEIAAAYTLGAISHRDAISIAYLRGVASSEERMKQCKGGMMAVGLSRDEANKILLETKIPAAVACVNSPSSVTISGDVDNLEALRTVLGEREIFTRRLKVDVAYHSSHMFNCSAEYYISMAGVGLDGVRDQVNDSPVKMISTVTGIEADADQLVPYYWVKNLVSPVLFVDAVKEMVRPGATDMRKTLNLLIEIGPHSALGGPIEQILSHYGIKNVQYQSVLTRGQNALTTALRLAGELLRAGVPFDVTKANGDSDCQFLTDLPSYPWNHSEQFRADSRMAREHVNQQFATKSLIGASLPKTNEKDHVWRSFIRLNDEPWLRGHKIGSTVLFPAAGMISVVLEAGLQVIDQNSKALSFKLRDISFMAAMALLEDTATEITVHLRPHMLGTSGTTAASWWEFTVSSCIGHAGQFRDNCRGLLSIVYEESRGPLMVKEDDALEAQHIENYNRVLQECPDSCTEQAFYDCTARSSLNYGEAFRAVRNIRPGVGKTCFEVEVVEIGDTFTTGRLIRPFLVHAGTLDCILQGSLGSTRDPTKQEMAFGFEKTMLPAAIGELEISANIPGDNHYLMPAFCHSHRHSFNEFSADIVVLNREQSKVVLSISDFRLAELDLDDEETSHGQSDVAEIDRAEISFEATWNYALDLLDEQELGTLVATFSHLSSDDKLLEVLKMIIHQQPTLQAVELVRKFDSLPTSLLSQLPRDLLLPAQAHYAVVEGLEDARKPSDLHGETFGQPFALGALDVPVRADVISADVFLVSGQVVRQSGEDLKSVLERLVLTVKPSAFVAIVTPDKDIDEIASSTLESKGFEQVFSFPSRDDRLNLYKHVTAIEKQSSGGNSVLAASTVDAPFGASGPTEITIVQPKALSSRAAKVVQELQAELIAHNYAVSIHSNLAEMEVLTGKNIVSVLELEHPLLDSLSGPDFELIQRLVLNCEHLLWVTCGEDPSFGMIDGFFRVLNNEVAEPKFQVLHLSTNGMHHGPVLARRLLNGQQITADTEFRERTGLLQVQRIYRSSAENEQIRHHLEDSTRITELHGDGVNHRLTIGKPGLLDSLHFARESTSQVASLGDHELELQVQASGINFRDVMASMGLIPITQLGYEASGIVLRAGERAADSFKRGDRVCTVSLGGMHASTARCDSRVTVKIPDTISFEEGAATPTVLATAYYALVRLAKLRRGQSVLIHAAAGGVGQAAIQLATHLGLVIYVTVGTEDKRRFIMKQYSIPEDHIFNSRDGSFAKGIQRVTKKRGVDCVLNSLSGELLRISWSCLASFGTFVEIGMRDIKDNMRLDMRPFQKTATFSFFELPALIAKEPGLLGEVLTEAFELYRGGVFSVPSPLTVYPAGEVEDAFRIMQQGKHRGKMVLSFMGNIKAPVLCKASDSLSLDGNATYLFIGGLGGLGRSLAKEFVKSGARYLAFISRSGDDKPEARATIQELADQGAVVKVFRADIANSGSFVAAMDQCTQQLPPVKGVLHMAMVLRDAVFEKMTYEDWTVSVNPKVQGSWNIHEYFQSERPLDFMVLCSSISGLHGSTGQAQYAAGNTYQDALARHRRREGLKAVSMNLGIMVEIGVLAEAGDHTFKLWENAFGIGETAFHALMKSAINGQQGRRGDGNYCPAQLCLGVGTADILATQHLPSPPWFKDPRFGSLVAASIPSTGGVDERAAVSLGSKLTEAGNTGDFEVAAKLITTALTEKIAEILRIPQSEVDASRPLYTYGVDSLVALEVRNWISREIKATMALFDIMAAIPMEAFAAQIAQKSRYTAKDA